MDGKQNNALEGLASHAGGAYAPLIGSTRAVKNSGYIRTDQQMRKVTAVIQTGTGTVTKSGTIYTAIPKNTSDPVRIWRVHCVSDDPSVRCPTTVLFDNNYLFTRYASGLERIIPATKESMEDPAVLDIDYRDTYAEYRLKQGFLTEPACSGIITNLHLPPDAQPDDMEDSLFIPSSHPESSASEATATSSDADETPVFPLRRKRTLKARFFESDEESQNDESGLVSKRVRLNNQQYINLTKKKGYIWKSGRKRIRDFIVHIPLTVEGKELKISSILSVRKAHKKQIMKRQRIDDSLVAELSVHLRNIHHGFVRNAGIHATSFLKEDEVICENVLDQVMTAVDERDSTVEERVFMRGFAAGHLRYNRCNNWCDLYVSDWLNNPGNIGTLFLVKLEFDNGEMIEEGGKQCKPNHYLLLAGNKVKRALRDSQKSKWILRAGQWNESLLQHQETENLLIVDPMLQKVTHCSEKAWEETVELLCSMTGYNITDTVDFEVVETYNPVSLDRERLSIETYKLIAIFMIREQLTREREATMQNITRKVGFVTGKQPCELWSEFKKGARWSNSAIRAVCLIEHDNIQVQPKTAIGFDVAALNTLEPYGKLWKKALKRTMLRYFEEGVNLTEIGRRLGIGFKYMEPLNRPDKSCGVWSYQQVLTLILSWGVSLQYIKAAYPFSASGLTDEELTLSRRNELSLSEGLLLYWVNKPINICLFSRVIHLNLALKKYADASVDEANSDYEEQTTQSVKKRYQQMTGRELIMKDKHIVRPDELVVQKATRYNSGKREC